MIYDGLLSRLRLREQMAERSRLELDLPSEVQYFLFLFYLSTIASRTELERIRASIHSHPSPCTVQRKQVEILMLLGKGDRQRHLKSKVLLR
jgi:hypothetical protein